ncbi:MAG: hypothetical protein IJC85_02915 [Oscillospiraceae bacterium]|nr:hypothetical protein [Oscillospiraceae bacterium]
MPQENQEFGFLRSRMFDLWERNEQGIPGFLGFLTPFEAAELIACLPKEGREIVRTFGGYDEAERVMLTFVPSWQEEPEFPLSLILFSFDEEANISHRDVLGALMGEGIKRDCLGDILVQKGLAAVFVKSHLARELAKLSAIGRYPVKGQLAESLPEGFERRFEETRLPLASLRLDCVVSGLTNLSRTKACELILQKAVSVDGRVVEEEDKKLRLPSVLSIRHYGKFRLPEIVGETRKGRVILMVQKYL